MRDERSQLRERPGIGDNAFDCKVQDQTTGNGVFAYKTNIAIKSTLL
jgi:hypothetical protein